MKYSIPLELLELEEDNYHLTVTCRFVNGNEGLWVIDTGASKTVFSKKLTSHYNLFLLERENYTKSVGIGSDQLDTSPGEVHPFYLGNFLIPSLEVALIDLSGINSLYYTATQREICGLIGSDFLMKYMAVIDYPRKRLILAGSRK